MPSTAIRRLSYDEATSTLFVAFIDGDTYAYFDVPAGLYRAFVAARSQGGFFAARVRDRFRYQRVDEPGGEGEESVSPGPGSGGPASPPPAAAGRSA